MNTVATSNCENEKKPKMYPTGIKTEMDIMVGSQFIRENIPIHTYQPLNTPKKITLDPVCNGVYEESKR